MVPFIRMDFDEVFPQSVSVTDQIVDVSHFSAQWKKDVIELGKNIADKYRKIGKERYIVAFGGASGSGKSTTAKVLESIMRSSEIPAVAVSQDGYHFTQEYLLRTLDSENKPLAEHKGRYDSFDVSAMRADLQRFIEGEIIEFPDYSRKIHNPIKNAIHVEGPSLLLFEGLWLLYDKTPWNQLFSLYDLAVFFHADSNTRKNNTVARHIRGNEHAPQEAEKFYETSDAKNAELILGNVGKHDLDFSLDTLTV